jgi:hypothetical protein
MNKLKLLLLLSPLLLSACQTLTPIAVATPQWQVPAVPADLQVKEQTAEEATVSALAAWNKWLSTLPGQPPPVTTP